MKLKKIAGVAIAAVIVISALIYVYSKGSEVSNNMFDNLVEHTDSGFEFTQRGKDNTILVRTEMDVYNDIHKMANTKIIADKIWGEEEINESKLNKLIMEVMKSDFEDKDVLLNMLGNWKDKNFSNCVNDHNYVWERLGGTVGRATGLR